MKRIITMLLTAAILSALALPACAAPWVTVSSWAYNSVSNFKKEGLLPESFDGVEDYTQNITRLQFAELVYSVQKQTHNLKETERSYLEAFRSYTDTDNEAAGYLGKYGIMEGEVVRTEFDEGMMHDVYAFYPDRLLTREEMAAVVYRAMNRSCEYLIKDARDNKDSLKEPADYKDISKWARDDVLVLSDVGVIAGMEDGSFSPKSNLTIEQAIQVLYSYYNLLPTTDEADGANIHSDYEETVQTYANGLTETKQGDTLYLKDGETVLMSFETDIYSNIYSHTVNGVTYAAAQNVYGKTDVYNARTSELLFKIPRCTEKLTDDYIITKSRSYSAPTFGVCGYDGTELFPPEYSKSELDEIKANGMQIPAEEYRAPDGWIYYLGENGGIYRIDTNGENKQKLSDNTTYQLHYIDGWLYYLANGGNVTTGVYETIGYYCTKADGSAEYFITDSDIDFIGGSYTEYSINADGIGISGHAIYDYIDVEKSYNNISGFEYFWPVFHKDGWIYYSETTGMDEIGYIHHICRMKPSDSGIETEVVIDGYNASYFQYRDGKLYFDDNTKSRARYKEHTNAGDLYCYDNGVITLLCDKEVQDFGFYGDNLILEIGDSYDETTPYIANLDGSNLHIAEDLNAAQELEKKLDEGGSADGRTRINVLEDLSDDKYTIYEKHVWDGDYYENTSWVRDAGGNEFEIDNDHGSALQFRIGDKVYWIENINTAEKVDNKIVSYDLETGDTETVVEGVKKIEWGVNPAGSQSGFEPFGKSWFTYLDYRGNIQRYNTNGGTVSEVYPSKGLHRYDKIIYAAYKDKCMYKIDADGNYMLMTDGCAPNFLYVANGAADGVHYLYFD